MKGNKTSILNQFDDYFEQIQESKGDVELMIADRIYVQKDFQFTTNSPHIESVDLRNTNHTAETINNFVKEKTAGRITEIGNLF